MDVMTSIARASKLLSLYLLLAVAPSSIHGQPGVGIGSSGSSSSSADGGPPDVSTSSSSSSSQGAPPGVADGSSTSIISDGGGQPGMGGGNSSSSSQGPPPGVADGSSTSIISDGGGQPGMDGGNSSSSSQGVPPVVADGSSSSSSSQGGQPGGDMSGSGGGSGFPIPSTSSSSEACAEDGSSAHYKEWISVNGSNTIRYGTTLSGCPNHISYGINEIDALHNPINESIPAYPMIMANGSSFDLSTSPNGIGIMRNGVALFSSFAAELPADTYENTAFYLEGFSFDLCGGHAGWDGVYHYHSTPGCLQEQAMIETNTTADEHSPVLGWSFDGFPVYGQLGPDGVEMKMCGVEGANAAHCLDVCSGYEAELPDVDDFKYRYYMSCGFNESFFPFTTNCYRGCCPEGMTCNLRLTPCDDDAEIGYTDDYIPEASTSLGTPYDAILVAGNDTSYLDSVFSVNCSLYLGSGGDNSTVTTTAVAPSPTSSAVSSSTSATLGGPTPSTTAAPSAAARGIDVSTPAPGAALGVDAADDTSGALPGRLLSSKPYGLAVSSALALLIAIAFAAVTA